MLQVLNKDPDILGGTLVFYGTRVPVKNLFDYLETGETIDTFLSDFDTVSKEQTLRVLHWAKSIVENSNAEIYENVA